LKFFGFGAFRTTMAWHNLGVSGGFSDARPPGFFGGIQPPASEFNSNSNYNLTIAKETVAAFRLGRPGSAPPQYRLRERILYCAAARLEGCIGGRVPRLSPLQEAEIRKIGFQRRQDGSQRRQAIQDPPSRLSAPRTAARLTPQEDQTC
jgi:hypothetical protein